MAKHTLKIFWCLRRKYVWPFFSIMHERVKRSKRSVSESGKDSKRVFDCERCSETRRGRTSLIFLSTGILNLATQPKKSLFKTFMTRPKVCLKTG